MSSSGKELGSSDRALSAANTSTVVRTQSAVASRSWSLPAGGNLPSSQLQQALGPTRAEDPLGLGFKAGERPPIPADPDPHDLAKEDRAYSRSLLDDAERAQLDEELRKTSYLSIEAVREIVRDHCPKINETADFTCVDPELMMLLDQRTNFKIFIAGDNVFTREELYRSYPFPEFGIQPEAIFAQQEIAVFPAKKLALDETKLEYLARDVGDETVDFIALEDLVGRAARDNHVDRRQPLRIAKTKIYLGRDQWDDFSHLQRVFRAGIRVAKAQIAYGGGGGTVPPLLTMLGFGPGQAQQTQGRLLTDATTAATERRHAEEAEARHAAEMKRLQEEADAREALFRAREEEARRKIEADLQRFDAMLAASIESAKNRTAANGKPSRGNGGRKSPNAFTTDRGVLNASAFSEPASHRQEHPPPAGAEVDDSVEL